MGLSLVPFMVLEIVLRLAGVGYETRLVMRVPNLADPNVYQFNPAADRAYYGLEDLSGPDSGPFQIPKPEKTFRIVVVGGSTVAGFPYPFELALPRLLEVVLREQLPERQFEVLNAGITAINSFSEVDIVRQIVACQPDLIVVHDGHNEFYGPGGSASNAGNFSPSLYGAMQALRRQRSFQLLGSLLHKPRGAHLIETLPADIRIPLDGPVFRETRERYRANLQRMVQIADQANIPIVLSTIAGNLRDLAPLEPSQDPLVASHLKEVENRISYREYGKALETLREARQIAPQNALVAYREGQCLEAVDRREEAAASYVLAADLDGCRFRAPSSFLMVVPEVVTAGTKQVYFCDVATELKSRSKLPVPGNDFFLEHVHYNLEGNWQVASILGQTVVEEVLGATWRTERLPDSPTRDKLLGVTLLDHLAADSLTLIVFEAWPFNLSPARSDEIRVLQARMGANYLALEPTERELFSNLNMSAMQQHLWHAMGYAWLRAGEANQALAAFQRHIDRRPWDMTGYEGAAAALKSQGKPAEAEEMLRKARQITRGVP